MGRLLTTAVLGLAAIALAGACRARPGIPGGGEVRWDEAAFAAKPLPTYRLLLDRRGRPVDTVIGRRRTHRVREGETLLEVARYHDLGYNEIVEANPGVDPWLPPPGRTVVLPTEWVLPCCTYEGIVLNIPEMRLYFYERRADDRGALVVHTHPVGLGREDRRTPRGRFRIRGKTVNPRWVIPESIRQEHIRERGDARTSIPGGDPENPLGRYRFELTLPRYAIHGTNLPWGAGMAVSHGCARLYPEDIERLFPLVEVGTPVELVYQRVKVGRRGGEVYVEVHPDLYRYQPVRVRDALASIERRGLAEGVERSRLEAALTGSRGLPVRVSGERPKVRAATRNGGRPSS
jgi:L,D-transpeptidase ErfK/SrfK